MMILIFLSNQTILKVVFISELHNVYFYIGIIVPDKIYVLYILEYCAKFLK